MVSGSCTPSTPGLHKGSSKIYPGSTTVAHLNMSDIPDIPIVVPDLGEQKEILSHIRAAVRRQELTVSKLQQQMELLTERRQSVINAAVTGELAVSGRVK